MDEIKVLDSKIFNRIAAGEVVESPKSVIKELIENSIDAGADQIIVEVESGGIQLIKVVDNGKGLLSGDMKTAFLPHATSKISKIEDLDAIATLGFRGEALPSIASVATITMISRKHDSDIGYQVKYSDGILIDEGDAGCPYGTTILVENIFKNIPARSKFLKKPAQEEGDISDLIVKIILANPKLSIKFYSNGELKYHSSGDGIQSAIFSIYGKDTLDNLTYIENTTSHIYMYGYISKPSYSKHNRNFQTLIVNGRYVVNQELSFCIGQCYQDYLMKRQFPMYTLYIELPLDMVDVNIQPNKMNVKFVDFQRVKGLIYNIIKSVIDKENKIPKNINTFMETFSPSDSITISNSLHETDENENIENFKFQHNDILKEPTSSDFNVFSVTDNGVNNDNALENSATSEKSINFKDYYTNIIKNNFSLENNLDDLILNNNVANDDNINLNITESFYSNDDYSIIGKIFNTYIIIQKNNDMILIDQHAAHEKIIFDKMIKYVDKSQIALQDLLIPFNFEITNSEKSILSEMLPIISELGFIINQLDELKYSIIAIPLLFSQLDLADFTSNLINLLENNTQIKSSVFIKEQLMQTACKSAIKGEMDLSDSEIKNLLKDMKQNNTPLFCPHGRPIAITILRTQIEKWFKRIV